MQQHQGEPGHSFTTSSAHGPNEAPSGQASQAPPDDGGQSAGEWAEIARRIEQQLRRDAARLVGAERADDWASIREALLGRVKGQAAELDRTEVGRRISDLGQSVEERVRGGLAGAAGAGTDADWARIGKTLRERVESALDPSRPAPPGGSGTGASVEDANVPSAPPSPDQPPRPASAGGKDTGVPTAEEREREHLGPQSAQPS